MQLQSVRVHSYLPEDHANERVGIGSLPVLFLRLQKSKALACVRIHEPKVSLCIGLLSSVQLMSHATYEY